MRLFLYILACGIVGGGINAVQAVTGPAPLLQIAANVAFVAGIAVSIGFGRSALLESPRAIFFAPLAYIATALLLGLAGSLLVVNGVAVGWALIAPTALGYTPFVGPDAPLEFRLPMWLVTNYALIVAGIAAGALLRRLRPEDE